MTSTGRSGRGRTGRPLLAFAALGLAATFALGSGVAFANGISASGGSTGAAGAPGASPTNPAGTPVKLPTAKPPTKAPSRAPSRAPAPRPPASTPTVQIPRPSSPPITVVPPPAPAPPAFAAPVLTQHEMDATTGDWVASDGAVAFGDLVQYVVEVRAAAGRRNLANVTLTDYLPGYAPAAPAAEKAALVEGSAHCTGDFTCTFSADPATGLMTWRLTGTGQANGVVHGGSRGTIDFVASMTPPTAPAFTDGVFRAVITNVADLDWDQSFRAGRSTPLSVRHHRVASNEVTEAAELTGAASTSRHCTTTDQTSGCGVAGLLDAGAPSRWLTSAGLALLAAGVMTVFGSRRSAARA